MKYGRLGLGSYENILFIQRHLIGAEDLGLIANFGNEETTVPNILRHDDGLEILLRSTNSTNPNTIPGWVTYSILKPFKTSQFIDCDPRSQCTN